MHELDRDMSMFRLLDGQSNYVARVLGELGNLISASHLLQK